jgi:hypothetical protein
VQEPVEYSLRPLECREREVGDDGGNADRLSAQGHGRFSINVHKADPDLPIIACGDIPPG